jgi:hypothetical protein
MDQAVPIDEFSWARIPFAKCEHWSENRVRGVLSDINGVSFKREIYHPERGSWLIKDIICGRGEHVLEWFFHFDPRLELKVENSQTIKVYENGWMLIISPPEQKISLWVEQGWFSPKYGVKEQNKILHGKWQGNLSEEIFNWRFERIAEKKE